MVYTYTPTYSSLHDSITSICKTILPFSFKKRRLPAAEQKLSKLQSDNLKWQQESFHQILNLMGLHKEGILSETEVSAFRSHLIDTLITSPASQEQPAILRDKLLFLQELFYAKCISVNEYHSSKRPLLQRLAVQGVEIEAKDVIVGGSKENSNSEEEWSVIDLRDEQCLLNKENSNSKKKLKHNSTIKQIKGAASVFGFASSFKHVKNREEKAVINPGVQHLTPVVANKPSSASVSASAKNEFGFFRENPFWDSQMSTEESETKSILMPEILPPEPMKENCSSDKVKKKPFRVLFQREEREGHGGGGDLGPDSEEREAKSVRRQWGFDGFKKWKRCNMEEDETAPLPLSERSDSEAFLGSCRRLVESPIGEGPDTKQIKRKLHSDGSASDFFIDKVLGEKIKKELSRIQSELNTTNPNLQFSNDQIEAISTKLPVDKADLKKFFPKSWCDRYGDVVLDVVKKEFKEHVGEMENLRNVAREKKHNNSTRWTTFEEDDDNDENFHPNLFHQDRSSFPLKQSSNPFLQIYNERNANMQRGEATLSQDQNPFWTPRHGS